MTDQAERHEVGHDAIARRAYEISQTDEAGTPEENWQRAERELRGAGAEPSSESSPSGPKRSSSCAIRSCEPWQRHATSSQTWTTRGGRGSSAKSA